ncbi:bifunctional diguanylate cyclase/phosphodiesterase [Mycobacterium sp. ITM-2016-00317]|uniref:putative bifunctional diguanylate cyclase/phosphodiesterase n=1 Tax=Mycobacterium sp. ITM-2016-00317 TaxID=2099694 RepID=UPI00287FD3E9|nr:bifunctional diguanylate cyclase/phosphodiesterase [Mycobacterium sp. ITM-2016-00317]WNG86402.1 bifunctional diguanylate cyclase/phosphodiesterase [Mycobacterium sp. ITM-2016-00317]
MTGEAFAVGGATSLAGDVVVALLAVCATGCAVLAARSLRGRMRTAWATMAVALATWAAAELVWLWWGYVLRAEPFPSPADVFSVAFCVFAFPAILTMVRFDESARPRAALRITLDGVTVALCIFLLAWILTLHGVYDTFGDDRLALGLALFYPAADGAILAVTVAVLARADARHRAGLGVLGIAFALLTVTDSAAVYAAAVHSQAARSALDIGWATALVAIGAAALLSRRTPPPRAQALEMQSSTALWAPYVPLLLVGTIGPVLVLSGLARIVVPLIIVAVCLRQAVAAWENRQWARAAAQQALTDPLTGLANRALFCDRLTHAMMLRSRDERPVVVAALDLDDFKFVNDNLGHPAADRLLEQAGLRIAACVRPGDTVARFGGDKFMLLLEGDIEDSRRVMRCVVDTFEEPFSVGGQQVSIRCSVGVAVATPDDADLTAEAMLERAQIAVRAAKQSRPERVRLFDAGMNVGDAGSAEQVPPTGAARVRLLGELRSAVDNGDLGMAYQPKVDLHSGRIVGVEALLRWPHPDLGLLSPGAFMPLVREHRLMRPVTDLVVDKVLDDAARWIAAGAQMPVAVNLFAPYLRDARLPTTLWEALQNRGLPADLLTVEVTEDLVITDLELVTGVLEQLRGYGIRVAIDDFGSGYSALSYLRDLLIDEIKLDRHFIASVTGDPRAAAIVRAVINLTHGLGMTVVAEGVEEAATARWLRDSGCDVGQGFYFGRPLDAADVPGLARSAHVTG